MARLGKGNRRFTTEYFFKTIGSGFQAILPALFSENL
jgi:hypothetical protein